MAYERKFGSTIRIVALKGKKKLEDATAMPDAEGTAFVDGVLAVLKRLDAKSLGKQLLGEIDASNQGVTIFCDDKSGQGSAALPYPATGENEIQRFVKIRQIPQVAVAAIQKANPGFVAPTMANYGALVHSALEKSKMNRDIVANLIGISRQDLDAIELGLKQLPAEAYHRFAMLLYDHLDPGHGCSVGLRFDPEQTTDEDPDHIILGHELVHTWRMVAGRRVFEGGWEEEAMTTGIPPFTNMKFSENLLRAEHGLPLRSKYTARCGTAHYQMVTQLDGGKGIWPEHVKAWEEWQKTNPEAAKAKIQLTNASVISSPVKTLFNR
jgi:hypothetical protein